MNIERALDAQAVILNNTVQSNNYEINAIMQSQLDKDRQLFELKNEIEKLKAEKSSKNVNTNQNIPQISCHICSKRHLTTDCWYFPHQNSNLANYDEQNHQVSNNFASNYQNPNFNEANSSNFNYSRPQNSNFGHFNSARRNFRGRRNHRGATYNQRRNHPYRKSHLN